MCDVPFAVLLGDDLIDARDPLLKRMIEEQGRRSATIVALLEGHASGSAAIPEEPRGELTL